MKFNYIYSWQYVHLSNPFGICQVLSGIQWFEFRVFVYLDWLPNQGHRTVYFPLRWKVGRIKPLPMALV